MARRRTNLQARRQQTEAEQARAGILTQEQAEIVQALLAQLAVQQLSERRRVEISRDRKRHAPR